MAAPGVVSLVDDEQVVGGGVKDELLVIPAPREVAGGNQQRILGVGVAARGCGVNVAGIGSVDPLLVQSRHPHAELLEQLVLPLSAHVGRCQDQGSLHLPGQPEPAQGQPGRDRLAEPDLVGDEPGARIQIC